MGEEQNLKINIIGIISSLFFFVFTVYLMRRNGNARDAQIYVPDFIGYGLWVLLLICFISFLVFILMPKIKFERFSSIVSVITLIILLILGLVITIGWFFFYHQIK
ncbi:hypothetical protein [Corticicoccus populi]|uniref:Uncharacterized protein n=1 Tax=Corticicoccus populi TaxID=1812821 RepID=A0ABW5WSJ1_9STAP